MSIIADPSNLTGADYFASVCAATDGARVYILDAFSLNTSSVSAAVTDWAQWCERWRVVLDKWREWVLAYGVEFTFCESNGVGAEFIRYARSQEWEIKPYASTGNKHRRIMENYENIISRVVWNDTQAVSDYLAQVYEYTGKDESGRHDDNIDCASSAFDIYYKQTNLMR